MDCTIIAVFSGFRLRPASLLQRLSAGIVRVHLTFFFHAGALPFYPLLRYTML
jgi:hypothetical protein